MRVFGYSVPLILVIIAAFIIGAKNPALLAKVPVLNKI